MAGFRLDPNNRHAVHPADVLRVDRQLLLNGPIALYDDRDRLRQHIEALESYGYCCPAFECSAWDTVAAMHGALADGLSFPDYYGHNLDALNDCMGDLDIPEVGGTALVLWRFDGFARRFPEVAWQVLDVIAGTSWFHLQYGRRLLGLVQSDDRELRFAPVGARPVIRIAWECHKRRDNSA